MARLTAASGSSINLTAVQERLRQLHLHFTPRIGLMEQLCMRVSFFFFLERPESSANFEMEIQDAERGVFIEEEASCSAKSWQNIKKAEVILAASYTHTHTHTPPDCPLFRHLSVCLWECDAYPQYESLPIEGGVAVIDISTFTKSVNILFWTSADGNVVLIPLDRHVKCVCVCVRVPYTTSGRLAGPSSSTLFSGQS